MDCPFCTIAKGYGRTSILWADEDFVAFHDRSPRATTHLLVIPRIHVKDFDDMQPELQLKWHTALAEVVKLVGPPHAQIKVNQGVRQHVPHLHAHVMRN